MAWRYCGAAGPVALRKLFRRHPAFAASLGAYFHAIYAYCRWADDLADETGGGPRSLTLLAWWREELLRCYDGKPRHPVMIALSETIRRFDIPPKPFLDLLVAFSKTNGSNAIGPTRNCSTIAGTRPIRSATWSFTCAASFDAERAALSDHICTGLQLANFWQDVARDLDIGRVYLPEEDRRRFGYPDDDLENRRFTPAFARLMAFEVQRAASYSSKECRLLNGYPRKCDWTSSCLPAAAWRSFARSRRKATMSGKLGPPWRSGRKRPCLPGFAGTGCFE